MATAAEIALLLTAKDDASQKLRGLVREIASAEHATKILGGSLDATAGAGGRFASSMAGSALALIKTGASIGLGVQIIGLLGHAMQSVGDSTIGMNARLETSTLQFETLTKDADFAKAHIKNLFEFAKTTPFETQPIIEGSRKLEAFGHAALNNMKVITDIGNTSAATGADFGELAFWVGRAYASLKSGAPIGEVIMRLTELAVVTGEDASELRKLSEHGGSAEKAWNILTKAFEANEGAMKKQEHTWAGLTSTFSDTIKILSGTATSPIFELLKEKLSGINEALNSEETNKKVESIKEAIEGGISRIGKIVEDSKDIPDALGKMLSEGVGAAGRFVGPYAHELGVKIVEDVQAGVEWRLKQVNWGELIKNAIGGLGPEGGLAEFSRGMFKGLETGFDSAMSDLGAVVSKVPGQLNQVFEREVLGAKPPNLPVMLFSSFTDDMAYEADRMQATIVGDVVEAVAGASEETKKIIERDTAHGITGNIGRGGAGGGGGSKAAVEALVAFTLDAYKAAQEEVTRRAAMAGGGSLIATLIEGIEKGRGKGVTPELLSKLASSAEQINSMLKAAFDPAEAYRFGMAFTDALDDAITTGTQQAIDDLAAILTSIKLESDLYKIGQETADTINQATVDTATAIANLQERAAQQIEDMLANRDLEQATRTIREGFQAEQDAAQAAFDEHQDQIRETRTKEKEQRDIRFRYAQEMQRLNKRMGEGRVDFREIEKQRKEIMFNYQMEQEEMARRRNEQRDDAEFERGLRRSLEDFRKQQARSRQIFEDKLAEEAFNRQINRIVAERDRAIIEANTRLSEIEKSETAKRTARELALAASFTTDWNDFNTLFAAPMATTLAQLEDIDLTLDPVSLAAALAAIPDNVAFDWLTNLLVTESGGLNAALAAIPDQQRFDWLTNLLVTGNDGLNAALAGIPDQQVVEWLSTLRVHGDNSVDAALANVPDQLIFEWLATLDEASLGAILNQIPDYVDIIARVINQPGVTNPPAGPSGSAWDSVVNLVHSLFGGDWSPDPNTWTQAAGSRWAFRNNSDLNNDDNWERYGRGGVVQGSGAIPIMAHGGEWILNQMQQESLMDMLGAGGGSQTVLDFRGATFYNLADFEDAVAQAVITAYRRGGLRFTVSPTGVRGSSAQRVGVSAMGGV